MRLGEERRFFERRNQVERWKVPLVLVARNADENNSETNASSVTTMASQSSSWKTTPTKVKTETIRTTTFTTMIEEGDTTNVDLGGEWQDILNQHAPLREYVRKRALEEKKESIFSTRGENDEKGSTKNNEAFAFAKEELRMLRKRFIEGDDDDITESIVVALQFDIDAGGLLDQFEREKLKRIRAMENGKRKASGLTARIGIARVEYLFFQEMMKETILTRTISLILPRGALKTRFTRTGENGRY